MCYTTIIPRLLVYLVYKVMQDVDYQQEYPSHKICCRTKAQQNRPISFSRPQSPAWIPLPRSPNVPLFRGLWSLFSGMWGLLKGSWGVLVMEEQPDWNKTIQHNENIA